MSTAGNAACIRPIHICFLQAASCAGKQLSAEPQTSFFSPGKRLKTPPASPAVHLILSSPESPDLASVPGRLPGDSCDRAHRAAHAAAAAPPGNAEVAHRSQAGHAGISTSLEGPSERAQGHMASTSAPARQQAVAGDMSSPSVSTASQGMSTPAQPQQVRPSYVARKTSASGAAGAENTPKKSLAQVLLIRLGVAVRQVVQDNLISLLPEADMMVLDTVECATLTLGANAVISCRQHLAHILSTGSSQRRPLAGVLHPAADQVSGCSAIHTPIPCT